MSSFQSPGFWPEFFGWLQAAGLSILDQNGALDLCQAGLLKEILRYFQLLQISNVKNTKHACSGIDEFVRGTSVMSIFSTASAHMFNDNQYGPIVDCVACHDVRGRGGGGRQRDWDYGGHAAQGGGAGLSPMGVP